MQEIFVVLQIIHKDNNMIQNIIDAASAVGITTFVTNSKERIETQLNSLTKNADLPIMLVSWDITTRLEFNTNGDLENPLADIVALLVSKPDDLKKDTKLEVAEEMAVLFTAFIQQLYTDSVLFQLNGGSPVTNASYKLVPQHGAGMHSGVLGRFTLSGEIVRCLS